ncbi:RNA-directed DNA polymerase, eukaryota [Tanacetum coccineum]
MGSFRSKEDDVSKISTSIFVTNFPDSFSAKDLFYSCKQYGHVVDSFIPTKRTKDGKRFGFVRFINVFNVERLTSELPIDKESPPFGDCLEDDCLMRRISLLALMGRVKRWPFSQFKKALCNEGFDVNLDVFCFKFWSGPTFKRIAAKWGELLDVDDYDDEVLGRTHNFPKRRRKHELSVEDNNNGRINDLEANNGIDESNVEEVLETLFDQPDDQKDKHSEDPFGLYPLLNKENIELARKVTEEDHSLSHPPGFTPEEGLNEVDGFDKLVRDSWNVAPVNKKNAIRNFMVKLKFLKDRIRSWLSIHRSNSRGEIYFLKEELRSCDEVIDKGDCSNEVVHKRTEILNKIHQREFFEHFRGRFDKPSVNRACIDTPFPVSLSIDQKEDMERRISKEEVKRAVWDCGVDKSPGPDGFSFRFYRHFWPVIENDVFEAVDYVW